MLSVAAVVLEGHRMAVQPAVSQASAVLEAFSLLQVSHFCTHVKIHPQIRLV